MGLLQGDEVAGVAVQTLDGQVMLQHDNQHPAQGSLLFLLYRSSAEHFGVTRYMQLYTDILMHFIGLRV